MSQQLISHNSDLKHLRDDGYNVGVVDGFLVLRDVPYITPSGVVRVDGTLISKLELSGDETQSPIGDHVAFFIGERPSDKSGEALSKIINSDRPNTLSPNLEANFTFSSKPKSSGKYTDYYEKMSTYATILSSHAESVDPNATPRTFPVIEDDDDTSVFEYLDTASSRAEIAAINAKLAQERVAIVGLGGSGSYIMDHLAKTPIGEIHLFDGDTFHQHTAFRSPGAATKDELRDRMPKVDYYVSRYSPMRRGIIPHVQYVDETNLEALADMNFVFVAVDNNSTRRLLVDYLTGKEIDFIDVGMGIHERNDALAGLLRVTTSTAGNRDFIKTVTPKDDGAPKDEYRTNIQVADLNALSAALAVVRWKKHVGFYDDLEGEHQSVYAIDGNQLSNSEATYGPTTD